MHYTDRCALCPGVNICVPPDGPENAGVLFIGEAPGKDEDKQARKHPPGKPFVGKTGDEVNRHYLPLAGLRRGAVCFTNAIRCLPVSTGGKLDASRAADQALLDSCASRHLYSLIERTRPALLVPLGAFACRAVLGEGFDLELRHGIPTESPWGIPCFPMYHPALGIHEPKKMLYIRTDWQRLGQYRNHTLLTPQDDLAGLEDYQEITDARDIDIDPRLDLAADTESKRGGSPFCLTYSQQPGVARLIRADRRDLLDTFQSQVLRGHGKILFHSWLHDWKVVEDMALSLPYHRIVDTLQRVFHLGNLPQGLKALAFRELAMLMQDFDDLVTPYSRERVIIYYQLMQTYEWRKPDPKLEMDEKTGLWKLKKPQGLNTRLKRFFTDLGKYGESKDVFKSWENWEDEHEMVEREIGKPWPGKCISHVPFEKTLYYACRDADALIRIWPIIKKMARLVRRYSQNHWRDYATA